MERILGFEDMIRLVDWQKHSLVPAIAQDSQSLDVLMLAYMNQEALLLSLQHKEAYYYSRSKNRIWKKGESSGHIQKIQEIWLDCDRDTLLLKVEQIGCACHTLKRSCFFTKMDTKSNTPKAPNITEQMNTYGVVDALYHVLLERKMADCKTSYTAQLFQKGENTIGKKIVEEAAELAFALKDKKEEEIVYEAADLLYHALVGLAFRHVAPERILSELQRRMGVSGIQEKENRP